MTYLHVSWVHDLEDEPIIIYSEIDNLRIENRKVEVYIDDSFGLASKEIEFGGTKLSSEPYPLIEEIAADPQFLPKEISKEGFEEIWESFLKILS